MNGSLCHINATVELECKYDTKCTVIVYVFNHYVIGILTPPLHTSLRMAEKEWNTRMLEVYRIFLCYCI